MARTIGIRTAIRRTGLSERMLQECIIHELVIEPLTHRDLQDLRRIRRLRELGINMPGIEVILHMRRRIEELKADLDRFENEWGRHDRQAIDTMVHRLLTWDREGSQKMEDSFHVS